MLRLIAAVLIILGSSAFGFGAAAAVKKQAKLLRDLQTALFYLKSDMLFTMNDLPTLLSDMHRKLKGPVGKWLSQCGQVLTAEPTASAADVFMEQLECTEGLHCTAAVRTVLYTLSRNLGRFDAEGQVRAIDKASEELALQLKYLEENRALRSKSYKVLGICSGLALAVILL